ncbi:hypothetical protein B0O99DRAFT_669449 [Bisporella sp. PMI_857]|nr:hypothetical protein B0O99DRAFT_669449 [Bisporella sp. PMI_857]
MVVPDRTSTGVDRRLSTRFSMHEQDSDDEYALAAMGISDGGYRPTDHTPTHRRIPSQIRTRTPPPRPSSTTKPQYDSFTLQHDGGMGAASSRTPAGASSNPMPVIRSSTVSSDVPYTRPESLYQGPTAPSHPYQMYPQQSQLARTASIATTSTALVSDSTYAGPAVPLLPYVPSGYPRVENNPAPAIVGGQIAGFPGRNNEYQRRLGPDGEEIAGIIGPDGHTEELPPYTQYDEALASKARPAVQIPTPAGAGGMGLATRDPEFASRDDLSTPHSAQSPAPSLLSEHQVNTAAVAAAEKPKLKKWQEVARRKVCGIVPIWVFVLIGICFVLFGIILGTVLAALKPPDKPKKQQHYSSDQNPQEITTTQDVTMTKTMDATPLTTVPVGIEALPTGTFALPITVPSVAPGGCLPDVTQSSAWSCQVQPLPYQVTITMIPESDVLSNNAIRLDFGNHTIPVLPYGAQPPVFNEPHILKIVNDNQNPERGPAWFFQTTYNKLVVVGENEFVVPTPTPTPTATVSKRRSRFQERGDRGKTADEFSNRKGQWPMGPVAGDKPWFCYWNGTLLEAFIYINQSTRGPQSFPSGAPTPSFSGAPPFPTGTNTYASSVPTQTSNPMGDGPRLPMYPKVFKLEERRVPGNQHIDPYCVQQIVNLDGSYKPLLSSTGQPIQIFLNETVPSSVSSMQAKRNMVASIEERGVGFSKRDNAQCGCVWLLA